MAGTNAETARVRWIGAEQFLAVTPSGHALPMDSDRESNTAPGPMEMLLAALGGCTATDVVSILAKKRQKLESLEIVLTGERAATPPRVWTSIEIVYRLRGTLDDKAVRDAIELSENKYCSVAAMLRKTADIRFRYEILPGGGG
jgi:putative redox protein